MAREVLTRLIDDIDGGDAHETVRFSLEGKDFAIDLSSPNAKKLRAALAPYVSAAVRVPRGATALRSGSAAGLRESHEQNQAIRTWAAAMDIDVSPRGRISSEVIQRFNEAGGQIQAESTFDKHDASSATLTAVPKTLVKKAAAKAAGTRSATASRGRPTEREAVAARGRGKRRTNS